MVDRVKEYSFIKFELREKLLPLLMQKVFHVTTYPSFTKILGDGYIKSGSNVEPMWYKDSYGRKNDLVSFFDLREKTTAVIDDVLNLKFNFLAPRNYGDKVVFLILKEQFYAKLITYEQIRSKVALKEKLIPHLESWYPKAISLGNIEEIIVVNIASR